MLLSGDTIGEYVDEGLISVDPQFDRQQLRPFGLRVHLGPQLLIATLGQTVDLTAARVHEPEYKEHDLRRGPFTLARGAFALASTIEAFRIDRTLVCRLDGRSTIARLGLNINCTATIVDGNHGEHRSIVLELANVGPFAIVLGYGIAIGMATFERVLGEANSSWEQVQYKGQRGVVPPNLSFGTPKYKGVDEK